MDRGAEFLSRDCGWEFVGRRECELNDRPTEIRHLHEREQRRMAQCIVVMTGSQDTSGDQTMTAVETHRVHNRRNSFWVSDEVICAEKR